MRYILGSLILSFGALFVLIVVLNSIQVKAPDNVLQYLAIAWAVLAVIMYPVAKKVMR